jgi:hypothetical protein
LPLPPPNVLLAGFLPSGRYSARLLYTRYLGCQAVAWPLARYGRCATLANLTPTGLKFFTLPAARYFLEVVLLSPAMYIPLLVRPQDTHNTAQRLLFQLVRLKLAKQTGEALPTQFALLKICRDMLWQFLCLCLQQRHALPEDLAIHLIGQLAHQILHNPAQVAGRATAPAQVTGRGPGSRRAAGGTNASPH